MIPDPDTLKRIRALARAYAKQHGDETFADQWTLVDLLHQTYLAGADAGYAAAKAGERKP